MTTDYSKLDAAILNEVSAPIPRTLGWLICTSAVAIEASRVVRSINATRARKDHTWENRVIDGRLQALRKAGRITHSRKPEGWSLAATQAKS